MRERNEPIQMNDQNEDQTKKEEVPNTSGGAFGRVENQGV